MKWNHRIGLALFLCMIISYLNPAQTLLKMYPFLDMVLLFVGLVLFLMD